MNYSSHMASLLSESLSDSELENINNPMSSSSPTESNTERRLGEGGVWLSSCPSPTSADSVMSSSSSSLSSSSVLRTEMMLQREEDDVETQKVWLSSWGSTGSFNSAAAAVFSLEASLAFKSSIDSRTHCILVFLHKGGFQTKKKIFFFY